jgi:Fe-S-cluster containining protein
MKEHKVIFFRPCGDCNSCCSGQLIGDIYGFEMGCGKKCAFLIKEHCSIYDNRPKVCRDYQCAWTQNLFGEDMRPDKIGLMVSVEKNENEQYFKVIEVWENVPQESYDRINFYAELYKTKCVYVKFNKGNL